MKLPKVGEKVETEIGTGEVIETIPKFSRIVCNVIDEIEVCTRGGNHRRHHCQIAKETVKRVAEFKEFSQKWRLMAYRRDEHGDFATF